MRYVRRRIEGEIQRVARASAVLILAGPRGAGKTTLLRRLFPKAGYALLEEPAAIAKVRSDPGAFLDGLRTPAILDEAQNAPEVVGSIRARLDGARVGKGPWILTASREGPLLGAVRESLGGRAALLHLLPLSVTETPKVTLLHGGLPDILARPARRDAWLSSHLAGQLERDLQGVASVRDPAVFRQFLGIVASRHGQLLNREELAAPLGLSLAAVAEWLGLLEETGRLLVVPPSQESFGKRPIHAPKIYVADSGLACHLLGIGAERDLAGSPLAAPLFEGFVASEIVKAQANAGRPREIYHFRDQQGLKVDFLVPESGGVMALVDVKATRAVRPEDADPLLRLAGAVRGRPLRACLVHRGGSAKKKAETLRPGVKAFALPEFLDDLAP